MSLEPREGFPPRPHNLNVPMLTEGQAQALADLCKRLGWSDLRQLATSDEETSLMVLALERVRGALEQIGVHAR